MWETDWGIYSMNSTSFKVMSFIHKLSRDYHTRRLNGENCYPMSSKAEFRSILDITEPTYRKVMADLTKRGYIRYKENRNHFVEVEVLV